jgi:hypothetical protein
MMPALVAVLLNPDTLSPDPPQPVWLGVEPSRKQFHH